MLGIIIFVIILVVWIISKGSYKIKESQYTLSILEMNMIGRDKTMEILEKFREEKNLPFWVADVFETDGKALVLTNAGIVSRWQDNINYIAYSNIKKISTPDIYVDNDGKTSNNIRMIEIETHTGETAKLLYLNRKGGQFNTFIQNINETGYPVLKYTGKRNTEAFY